MTKHIRSTATLIALSLGVLGLVLVLFAWRLPPFTRSVETTENAYVRGRVTVIAPQLAGHLAEVAVRDFEEVKAGQFLVRIDDRIFEQKVRQAEATLASQTAELANSEQSRLSGEARVKAAAAQIDSAETGLKTAQASWDRIQSLRQKGVVTQSSEDESRAALEQARAALAQAHANLEVARQDLAAVVVARQGLEAAVKGAEAALRLARIDLANTRITAPYDGRLGEIGAREGQYVTAGTQLMAIVPKGFWVTANFKETQLAGMKVGQPATLSVDALGGARLTGHIQDFSPATGSEFSVLKADNATGNFTKVTQRLPVRISIDPDQAETARLAPGMSVVVSIDTDAPEA